MNAVTERYEIATRVAVGPSALIYRGAEISSSLPVALKLLQSPEECDHALALDPVIEAAPAMAALACPHIAPLLEACVDEEGAVLVFPFIEGADLGAPGRARIEAAAALDIAAQLIAALRYGEQRGWPHGDLKPGNIVVTQNEQGRPFAVVLDWGLAAVARRSATPDSLPFFAPERLAGGPPSVRADLFSTGVTLFFALTGFIPASGENAEQLSTAWRAMKPGALRKLRPDLPKKFTSWIESLLAIDPAKRPASAAAALAALGELKPPAPPAPPAQLAAFAHMQRTKPVAMHARPVARPRAVAAASGTKAAAAPRWSPTQHKSAPIQSADGGPVGAIVTIAFLLAGLVIVGAIVWKKFAPGGGSIAGIFKRTGDIEYEPSALRARRKTEDATADAPAGGVDKLAASKPVAEEKLPPPPPPAAAAAASAPAAPKPAATPMPAPIAAAATPIPKPPPAPATPVVVASAKPDTTPKKMTSAEVLAELADAGTPPGAAPGAQPAAAKLLAIESFDYLPGEPLNGKNGGTGWAGPWVAPSTTVQVDSVAAPGLASAGHHVTLVTDKAETILRRSLGPYKNYIDAAKGGTWHFAVRILHTDGKPSAGGECQLNFFNATDVHILPRIIINETGTGLNISLIDRKQFINLPGADRPLLLLGRATVSPAKDGKHDITLRLVVNPNLALPDPLAAGAVLQNTVSAQSLPAAMGFVLRKKGAVMTGTRLDEIRIGRTAADVLERKK